MKLRVEEVCDLSEQLFRKQQHMVPQWQTLADNFYPQRADFAMGGLQLSGELADILTDSYPVLVNRDLANSIGAMLRDGRWFRMTVPDEDRLDRDSKLWLQYATDRQFEVMHNRNSGFDRAAKEGDFDYSTFGNTVISVEPNRYRNGVVYRCWHLRDCAWDEDESGQVCSIARRWQPDRFQLIRKFGKERLPERVVRDAQKEAFVTEQCRHIVLPSELYDEALAERFPYVSLYVHMGEKHIIEEVGLRDKMYVVPRFQTIAGSPYAYSPATIVGLPDARTLQAMTHTLLEAAERYARPPIVATMNAVTGVVDLSPDGVTWLDDEYDERKGQALRTLGQDRGGFPIGASERTRTYEVLERAFYLHTLNLPLADKEMTAYEVQERMKTYRQQNLPLFAPMESDYNGQLCEVTFNMMMRMGLFGSRFEIPEGLQGRDVQFRYKSPLTQTEQEQKTNNFRQTSMLLREAAELDAGVVDNVDFDTAVRDAIEALDTPHQWLVPPKVRDARRQQDAQIAAAQQAMEAAGGQAA